MIPRTEVDFDITRAVLKYSNECDFCSLRFGTNMSISVNMLNDQITQMATVSKSGFFAMARLRNNWGDCFVNSKNSKMGDIALNSAISHARDDVGNSVSKLSNFEDYDNGSDINNLVASLKAGIEPLINRELDWRVQYSQLYLDEEVEVIEGSRSHYEGLYTLIMISLTTHSSRRSITVNDQIAKRGQESWHPEDISQVGKNLSAKIDEIKSRIEAPRGNFPIILDSSLGAMLVHEIFGHGLEADLVFEGISPFAGKLGKQVTRHGITIIDYGNASWGFARYRFDQEGNEASRTVLIEDGYLINLIHNRKTAYEFDCSSTGNGRAGSIASPTISRASNIQVLLGTTSLNELISDIKVGVYAEGALGEVIFFPARDIYWLEAESGYLIEQGEITRPLSSFAITGSVSELLRNMEVIRGEPNTLPGFCLKRKQYVPVDTQSPPLYIGMATIAPIGGIIK